MKKKNMKHLLAAMMSAAMVMSMPMAAMAGEEGGPEENDSPVTEETKAEVEAPIYSFDMTNVIVPTSLVVAFNPDELSVKKGESASTDQVLSQNFGILNKSNKDKIVTVTLKVEDLNTDKITFVDSAADATGAAEGAYAVYLAVVPADSGEVKVGATSADKDTGAAAMADVAMEAATAKAVALEKGDNTVAFLLQKSTYTPKTGSELTLGGTDMGANDVTNNFELTGVAADGKGITAFTFSGALNKKADWSKLSSGIKITAVYDFQTTYDYTALTDTTNGAIVSGTGAMIGDVAPTFSTGDIGVIKFTSGFGDLAFASIVKMSAPWEGKATDIMGKATIDAEAGTITIAGLAGWAGKGEDPTVTIVYKNAAGGNVTATATLKTHE